MPRYYFDLRSDGAFTEDRDGTEFANADEAECEAMRTVVEMAADALSVNWVKSLVIEVRDWAGQRVATCENTLRCVRS